MPVIQKLDKRDLADRIIRKYSYRIKDALRLAGSGEPMFDGDIGSLTPVQEFKLTENFKRCKDYRSFLTWFNHHKAARRPFLTVRHTGYTVRIYCQRMARINENQKRWLKKS